MGELEAVIYKLIEDFKQQYKLPSEDKYLKSLLNYIVVHHYDTFIEWQKWAKEGDK